MICRYFKPQQVVFVANCPPKSDCISVMQQNINSEPFIFWPNLRTQNFYRLPTKTSAATVTNHKKLPQINFIRLLSVKDVGDNLVLVLKCHGLIFA